MRDIPGYENIYAATEDGQIYSYRRNKFLKPFYNQFGYCLVDLCVNGVKKTHKIHRLIATTFIPNPNNYETVDHIDSDKNNNSVQNLQWLSRADNTRKRNGKPLKD